MSLLAIPFACFIAATIARKTMRRYWAALLAAALVAVLGCTAAWMVSRTWWDSEDIPVLREAIDHDEGFEGVDEYDPKGDDHSKPAGKIGAHKALERSTEKRRCRNGGEDSRGALVRGKKRDARHDA